MVDDCTEAMDSCDKFVEQFTARLNVWLCILAEMVHKMVFSVNGEILYSKYFHEFEITFASVIIRQDDLTINTKLVEEEIRTQVFDL
jgi:hypothetical protein